MTKKLFLISLLMLFFLLPLFNGCKNPYIPEEVDSDVFEIMYERIYEVVNPNASDPTGDAATIWHAVYKGKNSSQWQPNGKDKWIAETWLEYHNTIPYAVWLIDKKVVQVEFGEVIPAIARKLCMRKKGHTQWIELKFIKKNPLQEGECAEVLITTSGIRDPSHGS